MKKIIFVLCACATIATTQAQVISLKECLERGLEKNYSIRITRGQEQISRNNATLANAGYLPTIDLKGGYNITEGNSDTEPGEGSTVEQRGIIDQIGRAHV